ncbi:hypothetical protein R1flu_016123 [Riccia fluitans]|uniref:Vacuolar ATPase assembly protein VMA22 n=1 Tax=Riccia fluitans TaxID=41844 RepID=A0ABD1YP02_9MARC
MPDDDSHQKQLEKEVWKCLDSVHHLLKRREILLQTLRQGWMELTSARYAMGPARISSPLFSLKPHAPSSVVDVRGLPSDSTGGNSAVEVENEPDGITVVFDLVRDRAENDPKTSVTKTSDFTGSDRGQPPSHLRRRVTSTISNDDEKKDQWEIESLLNDCGTEFGDESSLAEAPKETTQPLYWFGALVSPHLRSAQNSFSQALDLIVELVNAQNEATHAHSNVLKFQKATSVDEN